MHLFNVKTLELEYFIEGSIPPYAILSHRWTNEELNFKDVLKKRADTSTKGYQKLVKASEVTAEYELDYLWIDTCCIDKRSSAELSEAINSMFAWYRDAALCLAYLEDVESGPKLDATFRSSVWFTRSWTLQELLAPTRLQFYDGDWVSFGDKQTYAKAVEDVTGIDKSLLTGHNPLEVYAIADKMSWASKRTATRSEDIAYSLLGIFGVNMALLYGEGSKAFARLQEEIIRRTQDTSFLIWGPPNSTSREHRLLARAPADFQKFNAEEMSRTTNRQFLGITNVGLEIETRVCRMGQDLYGLVAARDHDNWLAVLVRKVTFTTTFVKLGIATIPHRSRTWPTEMRKMVVEWDADKRAASGAPILFDKEPLILALTVGHSKKSQVCVKRIFHVNAYGGHDHRPLRPGNTHIIQFDSPADIEVAKVICQISGFTALAVYVSFDFDCCPCALVCNERDEPATSAIFSYVQKLHLRQSREDEQWSIMENVNRHFDCNMYVFRSRGLEAATAEVPAEITGAGYAVHFSFAPPPTHGYAAYDVLGSWKFYITDHTPEQSRKPH